MQSERYTVPLYWEIRHFRPWLRPRAAPAPLSACAARLEMPMLQIQLVAVYFFQGKSDLQTTLPFPVSLEDAHNPLCLFMAAEGCMEVFSLMELSYGHHSSTRTMCISLTGPISRPPQ